MLSVVYFNKGICFVIIFIAFVVHIKYASRFQILTSTSAIWYISLIRNIPAAFTSTCKAGNNHYHHRRHLHIHRHNAPVTIRYWAVGSVSTMFPSLPVLYSFLPDASCMTNIARSFLHFLAGILLHRWYTGVKCWWNIYAWMNSDIG